MTLSLCMPFFRNAGMLAEQYRVWAGYSIALKARLEIVLVEDAEQSAGDVPRPDGLPRLRILRLLPTEGMRIPPWRQHPCRNLAAQFAEGEWLLLTDMDHVFPAESLTQLFDRMDASTDPRDVFRFRRFDAPDLKPTRDRNGRPKLHVNTFAIRKAHFWAVGGYDEDCVGYGTDGYFRQRLQQKKPFIDLRDVIVIRYPREVIPDASTRPDVPMDPRAFRNKGRRSEETRRIVARKRLAGEGPKVLSYPWELVL